MAVHERIDALLTRVLPGRWRKRALSGLALLAGAGMDSTRVTVTDPAPVKRKKAGSARVPSEMSMDAK